MSAKVSIITPCHNCEKYIAETIESVINQTFADWEMIIFDDCSSDRSVEIAREYAQSDARINVYVNSENSGAAVTRNNAIKVSQGEYLAFLDSDDIWLPQKLELQIDFMQKNNCDFSFTEYVEVDEAGNALNRKIKVVDKLTYGKMLRHCWPGCLTVMYRQNLKNKIYTPDIKKNNDHALFLKVLEHCTNARGIKTVTAKYRIRKGSISRNKIKMIEPYIKTVHELEGKNIIYAYFCAFTHILIKKLFKVKKYGATNNSVHKIL